jgi:hypothetical protein
MSEKSGLLGFTELKNFLVSRIPHQQQSDGVAYPESPSRSAGEKPTGL